jgi:glycosyltransferase involved in cell wall biosynthesis
MQPAISATEPITRRHPLTILHVSQPSEAGVARAVIEAASAAAEHGLTVHVACPPGTFLSSALEAADSRIRLHGWAADRDSPKSVPAEARALRAIVDRVRPTVVHLHSSRAGMVGRLALRARLPTIFQPHAWSFRSLASPAMRAAARAWEIAALRWTDLLLCVSEAERDALGLPPTRLPRHSVVANAVDLSAFQPEERADERARLRAGLGLPATAPVFICVGRLSRQKGQDVLLRAWPQVAAEVRDAQLLVVGSGPMLPALERSDHRGVRFLGERDDVPELLRAADVYVSAARWEGMSYALVEAAASGLSMVSTDVEGAREVIATPTGDEAAGVIVPCDDPEALATEMRRRATDHGLRLAEGRRARERALANHDLVSWRDTITRLTIDLHDTSNLPRPSA